MSATEDSVPISVEDLTVRYGRTTACAGISLSVARGAVYALLGRNGAGKSSLVRCLLGQQKPASGGRRSSGRTPGESGRASWRTSASCRRSRTRRRH